MISPVSDETKRCTRCRHMKPLDAFAINRSRSDGRTNLCRGCKKEYNADYYERTKDVHNPGRAERQKRVRAEMLQKVIEYLLEHPCVDCGETDIVVLQFDHVRGEKLFDISAGLRNANWAAIENEIAKCEVVCANDHMRRTANTFGWTKLLPSAASSVVRASDS